MKAIQGKKAEKPAVELKEAEKKSGIEPETESEESKDDDSKPDNNPPVEDVQEIPSEPNDKIPGDIGKLQSMRYDSEDINQYKGGLHIN